VVELSGTLTAVMRQYDRWYRAAENHATAEGHDVPFDAVREGYDRACHPWMYRACEAVATIRRWSR
jgi:hypothetical protein